MTPRDKLHSLIDEFIVEVFSAPCENYEDVVTTLHNRIDATLPPQKDAWADAQDGDTIIYARNAPLENADQLNLPNVVGLAAVHASDVDHYHPMTGAGTDVGCGGPIRIKVCNDRIRTSVCEACGMILASTLSTCAVQQGDNHGR